MTGRIMVDELVQPLNARHRCFAGGACHLTTDGDLKQLHAFARQLGLKQACPYVPGWCPLALPEPAATAVRREPVLAWIAAGVTVHRLHGAENTVARGRAAGIAYLTHRAQQAVIAAAWAAAQDFDRHTAGDTGTLEERW